MVEVGCQGEEVVNWYHPNTASQLVEIEYLNSSVAFTYDANGNRVSMLDIVVPIQLVLLNPILMVISVIFYRFSRKMGPNEFSRRVILKASAAWFLLGSSVVFSRYWSYPLDAIVDRIYLYPPFLVILVLQSIGWILLVYSMVIRKAAALTRKKRITREWTKKRNLESPLGDKNTSSTFIRHSESSEHVIKKIPIPKEVRKPSWPT